MFENGLLANNVQATGRIFFHLRNYHKKKIHLIHGSWQQKQQQQQR